MNTFMRFLIAVGVLCGLLYALLTPETFISYKTQSVVINGATNPMTETEIEKTLGVDQYLPPTDDDYDEENNNTN